MLKVALTGGIASGKSTVCSLFADMGVEIIDADTIAYQLTLPKQPCLKRIITLFGTEFIQVDGSLNRKKLRQLIFSDEEAKKQLEKVLHPKIKQQIIKQTTTLNVSYCILSIPLLIEANMLDLADRILVIDTAPELQLERLCQRDAMTQDQASNIIAQQCSRIDRLAHADDIIANNTTLEELKKQTVLLHKKYEKIAQTVSKSCQSPQSHGE